jgi:O-antigen ligase
VTPFLFTGLATLIALAPLPFGSNRLWSFSLIALIAGLLLLVWAIAARRQLALEGVPARRYAPALAAYAIALGWAFAQTAPGLPGVAAHPIWQEAAAALGAMSPLAAVSLDPGASLTGAMRLLSYGAVFWLALNLCRNAALANRLLWVVALSGSVYALYGLVVEFGDLDSVLWYRKWAYSDSLTATFVNRNSFATYIGMVAIAALALLANEFDHARVEAGSLATSTVETVDAMPARAYALIGCLILIATALLLTKSRAGIASTAVGLVVFLLANAIYRRRNGAGGWFASAVLAVVIALAFVSGRGVIDRLSTVDVNLAGRSTVWTMTREAVAERPFAGSGLGTFDDIYLAHRDERLPMRTRPFEHAHNSYLENALELGWPSAAALFAALGWLGVWCIHGVVVRRRHGVYPCVALGALSLGAMHAGFDFSLQIPAIPLCLAALLGAGCAQANRSGDNGADVRAAVNRAALFRRAG